VSDGAAAGVLARAALLLLALAPAAGLASAPAADAADRRHAERLLDSARAATGGAAWKSVRTIRYRAAVSAGGRSGSTETVEETLTGRYADRYIVGQVRGGQGFDGARSWMSDVTGTRISSGGPDGARADVTEVYRRSLAYWFRSRHAARLRALGERDEGGRSFELIAIEPSGGRPFEMWLDARTHRIARITESGPAGRRITELSDYRRVGDVLLPFSVHSALEGDEPDATVVVFESIEINPVLSRNAFVP
jgi:hypothetical protein